MTKSMAVELAPDRIRVNAVCPVIGETALLETFIGVPDTPTNRRKFEETIPLGRFSTPQGIAQAALLLASDEAACITARKSVVTVKSVCARVYLGGGSYIQ